MRVFLFFLALGMAPTIGGCAVVAVADAAGSVVAKSVGLAADAAVGTVKIAGKVVGKVADATLGSDKDGK